MRVGTVGFGPEHLQKHRNVNGQNNTSFTEENAGSSWGGGLRQSSDGGLQRLLLLV